MKPLFTHPQETWDEAKCRKIAKSNPRDYFGTKQRPGLIASSSSVRPQYGQTVRYNGGFIAPDGEHYQSERKPLPIIPAGFKFVSVPTWGTYLVKESAS